MYGYNIDRGINTAFDKVGHSVGGVTGPATNTLGQQIEQRPWLMIGAALVAGYVLGSLGGESADDDREQLWRNEERERAYRSMEQRAVVHHAPSASAASDHAAHTAPMPSGSTPTVAAQLGQQAADHAPRQPEPPRPAPRPQPAAPSPINTAISSQVDKLTASAVPTLRNLLRDTIRDNVPALRDQVDALDRRDGRTPPAPAPRATPATVLRDVDTYK